MHIERGRDKLKRYIVFCFLLFLLMPITPMQMALATFTKVSGVSSDSSVAYSGAFAPSISNPSPLNGALNVYTNPTLSISASDLDGDLMTVIFETNATGTWEDIRIYTNVGNGKYTCIPTTLNQLGTQYFWKISVTDDGSNWVTGSYAFTTTTTVLSSKWTATGTPYASTGVLIADVVGDSKEEIIQVGLGSAMVLNGTTGAVIWSRSLGTGVQYSVTPEIADLNKDGIKEIVIQIDWPPGVLVLRANDGSTYWTITNLGGGDHSGSPVIADIDGNGYPTIFVTTATEHAGLNSTSQIYSISYDGHILHQTFSWHACAGGLSLGDTDNDGVFELYVGDRNQGYGGDSGIPRGLRSFWASNLTVRWEHPEILCSSNRPMLADVNKDGILDVIIGHHSGGIGVFNSRDGSVIREDLGLGLSNAPVHYQPSVYDIDEDGNLEMLMQDREHTTASPVVWDLVKWQVDARLPIFPGKYGPQIADVTGDGHMDIIVCNDTDIFVFDKNYTLVAQVQGLLSRLMYAVVQDIDGDGYNEVVVNREASSGRIYAFDTPARTPIPRPRTEVRYYSERRNGAQEYVPPPGCSAPVISDPLPTNGASNVPTSISQLTFRLTDFQNDLMYYTVATVPDVGSGSGLNVANGIHTVGISGLAYSTVYTWQVNVTDGVEWTNKTFTFTTEDINWGDMDWPYRKTITINPGEVAEDQTNFPLLIELTDNDLIGKAQPSGGDFLFTDNSNVKLSHEIELYESVIGHLVAWVNVPFVSSSEFTNIRMYYGNPVAPNQEDPTATWDTSYKLVLHLSETHECRLWGIIANAVPHDVVLNQLISAPASLKKLGGGPAGSNNDGWGLVYYLSPTPVVTRGYPPAYTDPNFDVAANAVADSGALIGVGHVRARSQGGLPPWGDPHPFMRYKGGKWWAFAHNGNMNKNILRSLIGPAYLAANPPTYGANWDDDANVVDSDLYELFVLKCIEANYWNVTQGVAQAIKDLTDAGDNGAANFLLTDGITFWGFRRGNTLYYYQSTSPQYSTIASQPPDTSQPGWVQLSDYNFITIAQNSTPSVIADIRQQYPTPILVDPEFSNSVDSADLRLNGAGQDWYESRNDLPTLLYLDTSNVGGDTSKKAGFTADSTRNAYLTQDFSTPQTGTFTVQWDIYLDSILNISSPDRAGWMLIGDDSTSGSGPNAADGERFVYMAFFKDGGGTSGSMDLVAIDRTGSFTNHTVVASGLSLKQWYTVKVIVNVPGGTYDVYVGGVFKSTVSSRNPKTSVTHISFAQWNDGAGAFYVDNVGEGLFKLIVNVVGSGSVAKAPDSSAYANGETVTLTAVGSPGWTFAGWSGNLSGTANPATITMDSDKTVTATFTEQLYTLTVNVVGSGSVARNPAKATYNYGDSVNLTASPTAGWSFLVWSGDLSGNANPANILMTGNKLVTARFIPQGTSTCIDSTANGNVGILYNGVVQGAAGEIDGAYTFDGVDDYVEVAHSNTLTGFTQAFTASFWLKLTDTTRRQVMLNKYDSAGNQRGWLIEFQTHATYGKVLGLFASQDGVSYSEWHASFSPTAGAWYYVTVVWQSGVIPKFYVNGAQVATIGTSTLSSIFNNVNAPLHIGKSTYTTGRNLAGSLDEIRVSNPARSSGYILACYNNQKKPSTFYKVGTEESLPEAPMVSDPSPDNGATNVPITLTRLSFNLTDYQYDPMDYCVTTYPAIGAGSATGVGKGTYTVAISGLQYQTTYTWKVNVTDGKEWTNRTYTFTTKGQLLVDSEFTESADSIALRTDSPSQDWYESRNDVPTLLFLDESNVGGNPTKKAGFTASSSGNAYLTQELNPAQTVAFTAQWDIYVDSILDISSPDRTGIMMIGTSNANGPNRADAVRFVFLAFYKDGGGTTGTADLIAMTAFGTYTTVVSGLNLDQWYTIKVVVDVAARSYEVYVNGIYKGSFPAVTAWAQPAITHISFAQWNDGAGAFYIDNVFAFSQTSGNLPPVIDSYSPTVDPTISEGESQEFNVIYHDPEGDALTVQWYLNGTPTVNTDSYLFTAGTGSVGTYNVNVTITDEARGVSTFRLWNLTVHAEQPPLLVDSEFNDSVDSADLLANGAGQDWYESRNDLPTLLFLDQADVGGNSGKKAGFTADSTRNAYLTQEFSSAQTDVLTVQWDIYVDSILATSPYRAGQMMIGKDGGSGPNRNSADRFVYMAFSKPAGGDTGTMDFVVISPSTTIAAGLNLKQWYTIKVILNVQTGTYDVYVDGVFKATVNANAALTTVTYISFAQWNDGAGAFYVDNVQSPAIDRYKLTVSTIGSGSVTKTPSESTYAAGTVVTLTAIPADGWSFSGWSGDLSSANNPESITVDANKAVTATFTQQGSYDDVVFNSSFDMGNLRNVQYQSGDVSGNRFYTGEQNHTTVSFSDKHWWFYFSMDNVAGKTVTIKLVNNEAIDFTGNRWPEIEPVYSYDNINWERLPLSNVVIDETALTFQMTVPSSLTSGHSKVWLAPLPPYTIGRRDALFQEFASSPYLAVTSLGTTPLGQELKVATITDNAYNDAGKIKAYVIAQQHADEVPGSWEADGMIRFLLSNDSTAQAIRRSYIFRIVPIANVEGVYYGISRYTPLRTGTQYDLNRWWSYDISTMPFEVAKIFTDIQAFQPNSFNDLHSTINTEMGSPRDAVTYTWSTSDPTVVAFLNKIHDAGWPDTQRGTSGYACSQVHSRLGIVRSISWENPNDEFITNPGYKLTINDWRDMGKAYAKGVYLDGGDAQATLTTNVVGNGSITRNPNQTSYAYGTIVQLTAVANPDWSFDHWSGALSGSVNPTTILIDGNKVVTATFVQNQYTLTVNIVGGGSVSKIPDQASYAYGTNVSLTANAGVGWSFANWTGDASGTVSPVTVNVTGNKVVTATFVQNQYTLTVNVVGSGSVSRNPNGSSKPANSIWVEPSIIPLMGKTAGYKFNVTVWTNLKTPSFLWQFKYTFDPAHFRVTRSDYTGAGKSLFFTGLATVPLAAIIDNVNGSILCGESLMGSIQRAAGSGSLQWIEFEVVAPSTEEQLINVPGDTFVIDPDSNDLVVTKYSALASWNISSSEEATYAYGTNVTLTASANVGWSFANWTGDASGTVSPVTVNMTGNKVVTATFTQVSVETHDVAVSNVTTSKQGCIPYPIVFQNFTCRVFVTVENLGNFTETFRVSAYVNSTMGTFPVAETDVTLLVNSSETITFIWNTQGLAKGNYTVHARAETVANETEINNNEFNGGLIGVTMIGDIYGMTGGPDGKVDMRDIGVVAQRFGVNFPNPLYNPNFDTNDDGKIDMRDIGLISLHFGEIDP
jgi:uncharacterized repeat protein (TIGR02543 family)